ncbi:MAG: cytidylate kinase-like family protein [Thermodesulfobacteriota bacterium]
MAILTLARMFGAGGAEIGQDVSTSLGYEYVDKQTILSEVKAIGQKWEQWGKNLDEHGPSIWEKYDWSFQGFAAIVQSIFLHHAFKGKAVLVGRGGNFLLEDIPFVYKIRVFASEDSRIERIITRESVDRETARWLVEKTDQERVGFIQSLYGKATEDPQAYDDVFDTGVQPLKEIAAIVKEKLLARDKLETQEVLKQLEMRALAARVKVGLVTDPTLYVPTLDVVFDGKELVLRGIVRSREQHCRLEEAAIRLAGGVPLNCQLHYRG